MQMRFRAWKDGTEFVDTLKKHSALLWWMVVPWVPESGCSVQAKE